MHAVRPSISMTRRFGKQRPAGNITARSRGARFTPITLHRPRHPTRLFAEHLDASPALLRDTLTVARPLPVRPVERTFFEARPYPSSNSANRSAAAMSSIVLALKKGSSGVVGQVTVARR